MKRDVDIEDLVASVEKRVLARIAAALTSAALPSFYSTRRKCGPPGLADSACKATLPTIPGAVKRGRWWVIDRRRYEQWEAAQVAQGDTRRPAPANDAEEQWSARGALESVGLRPTRGQ